MESVEAQKVAAAREALELAGCPRARLAGRVEAVAARLGVVDGAVVVLDGDGQPRRRARREGGERLMTAGELVPELLAADRRGALEGFQWAT